jgi:hypothetical protein
MAVENEEIEVQRAPLIFIVPALGFVVTARTKQFQLVQSTNEQISYPGAQRLRADRTREVKPEQGWLRFGRRFDCSCAVSFVACCYRVHRPGT